MNSVLILCILQDLNKSTNILHTRVYKRMDHLFKTRENVLTIMHDVSKKYIVFSDFHRGVSDRADDFKPKNRKTYVHALSYYYNNGYTLIHLGDVEELKEQFLLKNVVDHQPNESILTSEKLFYQQNRLIKVFGNHDSQWSNTKTVRKYLEPHFSNVKVYEGVLLEFKESPDVMLVHGHQGYSWIKTNIAEKLVLPIYKLGLNLFGVSRKVNYESYCKIDKIENEFYDWVKDQEDMILVFGHTHRPLWGSSTHIESLEKQLDEKRKKLEDLAREKRIKVRELILNAASYGIVPLVNSLREVIKKIRVKMKDTGVCRSPLPLPLLFNTGCCIFDDGDITGIEIDSDELRLIKWGSESGGKIERKELEKGALDSFVIPN